MADVIGTISQAESRPSYGLSDGGHIFLKCSKCGESLVDLWITNPDVPERITFQAGCGLCGDHSFIEHVRGLVHIGVVENNRVDIANIKTVMKKGSPIRYVETVKKR